MGSTSPYSSVDTVCLCCCCPTRCQAVKNSRDANGYLYLQELVRTSLRGTGVMKKQSTPLVLDVRGKSTMTAQVRSKAFLNRLAAKVMNTMDAH